MDARMGSTTNDFNKITPVNGIPDPSGTASMRTRSSTNGLKSFQRSKSQIQIHNQNKQTRQNFRMQLSSRLFVWCWWSIFCFRSCSIAFLTCMAWVYYWVFSQMDTMAYLLMDIRFEISFSAILKLNWLIVGADALQIFFLFRSIWRSLKARELTFSDHEPPPTTTSSSAVVAVAAATATKLPEEQQQQQPAADSLDANGDQAEPSMVIKLVAATLGVLRKQKIKWIDSVFFIHGKYFEEYFLVRENLEVGAQMYQAFRMSMYIPTRWINHLCVAMIALNCLSTPVIYWWIPESNTPLRRLLSLVCNSFLNFVNSVVVPLIIFWPYLQLFQEGYFPDEYVMNDVWYAKANRENQQLFVTSYLDFFTTLTPHWSLVTCLLTCEDLLAREAPSTNHGEPTTPAAVAAKKSSVESTAAIRVSRKTCRSKSFVLHNTLWIMGILVIAMHIHAQRHQDATGCQLFTAPWLTSTSSCVVMDLNCYRSGIEGNQQQVHDILVQLNDQTMFQLVISHCPRLQIPASIRRFGALTCLNIYNCTLDQWSSDASLNGAFLPYVSYVELVRTNLSMALASFSSASMPFPEGLLDLNLPSNLLAIYFFETNVTALPPQLEQSWRNCLFWSFEFADLHSIPSFLLNMKDSLTRVLLTGNPIEVVDLDLFQLNQLTTLALSDTLIRELPTATTESLSQLNDLELEYTQLTTVPAYIREWYRNLKQQPGVTISHSLYGSPYCDRNTSQDQEEWQYQQEVCAQDQGFSAGSYQDSMAIIESQRQL